MMNTEYTIGDKVLFRISKSCLKPKGFRGKIIKINEKSFRVEFYIDDEKTELITKRIPKDFVAEKLTRFKLLDDLDIEYGTFDTKQEAVDYRMTRRTICIWTGANIKYKIIEINNI